MSALEANTSLAVFLDVSGLAERLGVTERFIRALVEENRIPYNKIGKFVRFHPDDINEWLADTRVAPHK